MGLTFDVWASTRVYRMPLDDEDRSMATGAPFLLRDDDGAQPPISHVSSSVAVAMALRHVSGGAPGAYRHDPPARDAPRARPQRF